MSDLPRSQPIPTLIPPDERFWRRYSPHFEMPLSGVSTLLAHLLVLFTVVLVVGVRGCSSHATSTPVALDTIAVLEPGSGEPDQHGATETRSVEVQGAKAVMPIPTPPKLPPVVIPDTPVPPVAPAKPNEDTASSLHDRIVQALEGSGRRNGKGGPGNGGPGGPGSGIVNARIQRWVMEFEFADANEYIRQLHFLGAEIGIAKRGVNDHVLLIRDLTERPAKPEYVTVESIGRIFWCDRDANSVLGVFQALGVLPPEAGDPVVFYAFMPVEMENALVEKEMAYARRFGRKTEADIAETVFRVELFGNRPVITVKSQKGKTGTK